MKSYGRLEVRLHTFSTSAPVAATLPAPRSVRLTPGLMVFVYTLDRSMLRPCSLYDCCRPEKYVTRSVASCPWTNGSWGFDGTYCLRLHGITVQEELGLLYPLTKEQHFARKRRQLHRMAQCHIPQDLNPQLHRCENLKSHVYSLPNRDRTPFPRLPCT
jgi:hypothetical protein